jgi:hypothetical protein
MVSSSQQQSAIFSADTRVVDDEVSNTPTTRAARHAHTTRRMVDETMTRRVNMLAG